MSHAEAKTPETGVGEGGLPGEDMPVRAGVIPPASQAMGRAAIYMKDLGTFISTTIKGITITDTQHKKILAETSPERLATLLLNTSKVANAPTFYKCWLFTQKVIRLRGGTADAAAMARFWARATARMNEDLKASGDAYSYGLSAILSEMENVRQQASTPEGRHELRITNEPRWHEVDPGPGVNEALDRLRRWVAGASAEDISRFAVKGQEHAWPLILKASPLVAGNAHIDLFTSMLTPASALALLDNPAMNRTVAAEILTRGIIASRGKLKGKDARKALFLCPARGISFTPQQVRDIGTVIEENKAPRRYIAGVREAACGIREVVMDKSVKKILFHGADFDDIYAIIAGLQGADWAGHVKQVLDLGNEGRMAANLPRYGAWNMEGVSRQDLLFLLGHSNEAIRHQAIRLAGLTQRTNEAQAAQGPGNGAAGRPRTRKA